jgi:hypothetical protein
LHVKLFVFGIKNGIDSVRIGVRPWKMPAIRPGACTVRVET